MSTKDLLLVLDFDGVLLDSYSLIKETLAGFGLDVGDEHRFRNRRKFLKYLGGGKELLSNLVGITLPKTRRLRERLTENYCERGQLFAEFVPLINRAIANPRVHCGVVSRNFTRHPGATIRTVLRRSGVLEDELDFVVPLAVGAKKDDVLAAMCASRYRQSLLCADEIGDYRAGAESGYECLIGSYGFDTAERLMVVGEVPAVAIYHSPAALAAELDARLDCYEETGRREASTSGRASRTAMGAR